MCNFGDILRTARKNTHQTAITLMILNDEDKDNKNGNGDGDNDEDDDGDE
jgi:hypothetical protein